MVVIVKLHYPDHTDPKGLFGVVDVKALMPVKTPVMPAKIKAHPELSEMFLVRHSHLSVGPVTEKELKVICKMTEIKA